MSTSPDKSRWSTRYYRSECPELVFTMKTNGPDDRKDPPEGTRLPCVLSEHDEHPLRRISPEEFARLSEDDDEDDDD